jgi:hypothetical protein
MQLTYATMFECDACGKHEQVLVPEGRLVATPKPEGWGLAENMQFVTADGYRKTDVCPACMFLPMAEVVMKIIRRQEVLAGPSSS